jgi:hypothetical protein
MLLSSGLTVKTITQFKLSANSGAMVDVRKKMLSAGGISLESREKLQPFCMMNLGVM